MLQICMYIGPLLAAAQGVSDFITPEAVEQGMLDFGPLRLVVLVA